MPLFLFIFHIFITYIHTFIQSHSYNTFIRRHSLRPLSISSSLVSSVGEPPCGAKPRIELGPAFQQADSLPTEPRRTIKLGSVFNVHLCWIGLFEKIFISWLAMSNQRSFKIDSFRFVAFVPKKIEYILFWNKILDRNKRFLSLLEKFGPKAFVLVCFQIFLEQQKVLFCFWKPWRNL